MNELNYDNKHFASGTYSGTVTNLEKETVPLLAVLNFNPEDNTITGSLEDHDSGSIDVTGTYNPSPPFDFKLTRAGTTYNGFKQNADLIGRYKNTAGKGVFKLKPQNIVASAKFADESKMSQEDIIQELVSMGFIEEQVREAIIIKGLSLSEAVELLSNSSENEKVSPEVLIDRFLGMGFEIDKIQKAVSECDGNAEAALQALLSA
eukprot:TRINITY_DN29038_c0_g1_i1.p1 TRINITY_DN29038_c0_g1~~TRINITY_DN29038_c0_g1_i1.p1  ORF type:complete len:226 (+),score=71.64 TRINITY_DN29038_c0_g1_i1:62-679(+)